MSKRTTLGIVFTTAMITLAGFVTPVLGYVTWR